MHTFKLAVSLLMAVAVTDALPFANLASSVSDLWQSVPSLAIKEKRASCPSVWKTISTVLTADFVNSGQCSDDARSAIRAAFHDCFTGACDGSLILGGEYSNSENQGISDISLKMRDWAKQYSVGVADMIQFAAAHAVVSCPKGPVVTVKVGRKDSSTAAPTGILPTGFASGSSVYKLFTDRGFSAVDLAALIGAHSSGRQFFTDTSKVGAALDSTPGIWDVAYYGEVLAKTAPYIIPADAALANHSSVGPAFKAFVGNQDGWNSAFVSAMEKMSMMGVSSSGLIDCTSALPKAQP